MVGLFPDRPGRLHTIYQFPTNTFYVGQRKSGHRWSSFNFPALMCSIPLVRKSLLALQSDHQNENLDS